MEKWTPIFFMLTVLVYIRTYNADKLGLKQKVIAFSL